MADNGIENKDAAPPKPWVTVTIRIGKIWQQVWVRYAVAIFAGPLILLCAALGYYYVSFARILDARLHGERDTVFPRVLARPLEIRRGQSLTDRQLVDRLNDLGYAQRTGLEKPGEFVINKGSVSIKPRGVDLKGQVVRVIFQRPGPDVRQASRRSPQRSD